MKATGIVRKVDGLGRIVLPIELRRVLDIQVQSDLEIFVDNGDVILRKYTPNCIFCGSQDGLTELQEKSVCANCVSSLKNA